VSHDNLEYETGSRWDECIYPWKRKSKELFEMPAQPAEVYEHSYKKLGYEFIGSISMNDKGDFAHYNLYERQDGQKRALRLDSNTRYTNVEKSINKWINGDLEARDIHRFSASTENEFSKKRLPRSITVENPDGGAEIIKVDFGSLPENDDV
jgi:hypothetical protein